MSGTEQAISEMSTDDGAGAREPPVAAPGAAPGRLAVFSGGYGLTTAGIVLVISAVAFEGMGVSTAMPAIMDDIGSDQTYAWPFVAFLASSVLATVVGGRWADRRGPRGPLVIGVLVFGVGLLLAGLAPSLPVLLAGRALQGLGAGGLTVAIFVLVALVYPTRLRPAVFVWTSTAWVLPSLLGPPAAAFVTETFSWHWVFLGIAPIAAAALVMMARVLRRLPARDQQVPGTAAPRLLMLAAVGAAGGVAVLSWAGEHPTLTVLPVVAVALVALIPSVLRLVPRGTLRASRGIGTAVLARGMLAGSFFAANTFLPLMLTRLHGWEIGRAGAVLIAGSLGWAAASAWQGGHPDLPRHRLLRVGFALVASGLALVVPIVLGVASPWFAFAALALAGLGMGLGMSSVSLLVMGHSGAGEIGFNTAAAQILDGLSTSLLLAVGGALTAVLALRQGLVTLLLVAIGILLVGVLLASRSALAPAPMDRAA